MRKKKEEITNSVIGKNTEFKGVLKDKENVRIDGKFEGEIQTEGTVIIGEEAVVQANITAKAVDIGGKVVGDISCEGRVELFSSGSLEGKIRASDLTIAEGAFFNGECNMTPAGTGRTEFEARDVSEEENEEENAESKTPEKNE
jgi:cytoskeletal protein CcmA (bactofilin family)